MQGSELKGLIKTLPRKMGWNGFSFYQYQGCWIPSSAIQGIISFHRNFHAKATDLLLCTLPKSGTTWLKALAFSIVNRDHYAPAQTTCSLPALMRLCLAVSLTFSKMTFLCKPYLTEIRKQNTKTMKSKIQGVHNAWQQIYIQGEVKTLK